MPGRPGFLPRRFGPFATTPFTRSRARLTNRLIEPSDQRAPLRAFSASLPPRCGAADRGYTAMVIYGCANPKRQTPRVTAGVMSDADMATCSEACEISADLTIPVKDVKTEQVLQLLNKYC